MEFTEEQKDLIWETESQMLYEKRTCGSCLGKGEIVGLMGHKRTCMACQGCGTHLLLRRGVNWRNIQQRKES